MCKWIKRHLLIIILILIVAVVVTIPFLINESYKRNMGYVTVWDGKDFLLFYGSALGAVGTIVLGFISWKQNQRILSIEERTFLAENCGSALITNISISGIKTMPCNLENHIEQIVATKECLESTDCTTYNGLSFACTLLPMDLKQHIALVSVKNVKLSCSSDGKTLDCYVSADSFETNFSRVAISQNYDRFQFTILMHSNEKGKIINSLKSSNSSIVLDAKLSLLTDKGVCTELLCRAYLQNPDYDEKEEAYCNFRTLDDNPPICFWNGTETIKYDDIKIKEITEDIDNG